MYSMPEIIKDQPISKEMERPKINGCKSKIMGNCPDNMLIEASNPGAIVTPYSLSKPRALNVTETYRNNSNTPPCCSSP